MTKEQRKRFTVTTLLLRILFVLIGLIIIVSGGLFLYLNYKKNDISKDLLTAVNKELQGDFSVKSISLGSLFNYPNLLVSVKGLTFHAATGPHSHGELILDVNQVDLRADLTDVFSKKIFIEEVYIKGASFFIERDSAQNMIVSEGFQPVNTIQDKTDSINLSVHIDKIHIEESQVAILDRPTGIELPFAIRPVTNTHLTLTTMLAKRRKR